jgi:uncharacterized protein (DUF885 family)
VTDSSKFTAAVNDYFDALFASDPSLATAKGIHDRDGDFPDLSARAHLKRIEQLKRQHERFERLGRTALSDSDWIDGAVIAGRIQAELLDLETIANWRRNPIDYLWLFGGTIDGLIKRNFAPPSQRLKSLTSRLRGIPRAVAAMKVNITDSPSAFTDLAIRMARGSTDFFGQTLDAWATKAADGNKGLLKDFEAAHLPASDAIESVVSWLEEERVPRSKADHAIGEEAFLRKLRYEEMVDLPLSELLAIGEANLERDYRDFVQVAEAINPNRTPSEVMRAMSDDYPAAENLIRFAKDTLTDVVRYIKAHQIVTLPRDTHPSIMETPPYLRSGVFAAMDTPGPYEQGHCAAYYYVTPPEPDWDPAHATEHLRLFNRPVMEIITIHEAYPGHYVQFLNASRFPTRTRKILECNTNVEGWAHYAEQMMIEANYGRDKRFLRLAQLQEALLRDCRFVVGIKLHTEGMTLEKGAELFEEKGFQEPANAYEEARRGTYDPTYLSYTLGKLQIYKLRDDWMKAKRTMDLKHFHDAFLVQGGIPIRLLRKVMLDGDKEPAVYDADFYRQSTSITTSSY